jgi:DNA replication and repair protein RecF
MSRKLIIKDLALKEFRNYHDLNIRFDDGIVIISGPNGVGKTNILESLSLIMPGRGFRSAKLSELDNKHQDAGFSINWQIASNIYSKMGDRLIEITRSALDENDRCEKLIKMNGNKIKNKSTLVHFMSMVWLTPQMDFIFIAPASERRKFLDHIVADFFSSHTTNLNQFEHLMRERIKILRESNGRYDRVWLETIETQMSQLAIAIVSMRLDTISHLNASMNEIPVDFLRAQLIMNGFIENLLTTQSSLTTEEMYSRTLSENRNNDANSGRTNYGPHLSDLEVINLMTGAPASACSTGEQKSLLISVKFAEVLAKDRWHGVLPVMLLDDILSHLDHKRRIAMLEALENLGIQSFVSCTSTTEIDGLKTQYQNLILSAS